MKNGKRMCIKMELDLFGKKESLYFIAETVALYHHKNQLNDDLLGAVKELQGRLSQMSLEEYEEYYRRIKVPTK